VQPFDCASMLDVQLWGCVPRHVRAGKAAGRGASTLVEFFLAEVEGGTLLRVVERGFAALDVSPERRASSIEGNTKGWEFQLDVAKRDAEQPFV